MRMTRRRRIEAVVLALEEQMRTLQSLGLKDSAFLVRVAWLDLRCRNDRISERELKSLCDRVSGNADDTEARPAKPSRKKAPPAPPRKRSRTSGKVIDMRAWRTRVLSGR